MQWMELMKWKWTPSLTNDVSRLARHHLSASTDSWRCQAFGWGESFCICGKRKTRKKRLPVLKPVDNSNIAEGTGPLVFPLLPRRPAATASMPCSSVTFWQRETVKGRRDFFCFFIKSKECLLMGFCLVFSGNNSGSRQRGSFSRRNFPDLLVSCFPHRIHHGVIFPASEAFPLNSSSIKARRPPPRPGKSLLRLFSALPSSSAGNEALTNRVQ